MANESVVGILRILFTADSSEFQEASKRAADAARGLSKDLKSIGKQAMDVGGALTKTLTLPIVAVAGASLKAASDFESSFAGIRKTVDGVVDSAGNLTDAGKEIQQAMRDLSKEIPVNVNELNRLGEAAGALGVPREEVVDFVKVMAQLGVTTNLTSDQAADAIARIQNIFGAAGKDTDRLASTIVALGNSGASTEKNIVEMGLRIAGAGNSVGLAQAQVLAFASALSSVGIEAEAGGSAISRIFLKMNDAVMDGGDALEEFARVAGVSAAQFKQVFEQDAAQATVLFINGLKRLKGEGENTNATMEGLIGKNIILKDTLNRLSGAGALLAEQLELGNKAWDENTALTKEAEQRFRTFESQLTLFWNTLKDVGITLGTSLLPALQDLLKAAQPAVAIVEQLAKWFAALPEPARMAALGIGGMAAAAGPTIYLFGQLADSSSKLIALFGTQGIFSAATLGAKGLDALKVAALGLGQAFGAILVVGGSVVLVSRAIEQASKLSAESAQRASGEATEQARRYAMMAEAAKIAGHSVHSYADAVLIVTEHYRKLADAQKDLIGPQDLGEWQGPLLDTAKAAKQATDAAAAMSAELAAMRKEAANLSPAQRKAIADYKELGKSAKDTAEALGISEDVVKLYREELSKLEAASKKSAEASRQFRDSVRDLHLELVPLAAAAQDAGEELQNIGRGLSGNGTLRMNTLAEAGEASAAALKELTEWAERTGAVLPKAIKDSKDEIREATTATRTLGQTIRENLIDVVAGLPDVFVRAFTGGGGLMGAMKALGVQLADALVAPLMARLKDVLARQLSGAIGSGAAGAGGLGGSALLGLGLVGGVFAVAFAMESARKKAQEYREALSRTKFELLDLRNAIGAAAMAFPALNDEFDELFNAPVTEASLKRMGAILAEMQKEVGETNDEFADLANEMLAVGGRLPEALQPAIQQLITLGVLSKDNIALFQQLTDGQAVDWKKMQEAGQRYGDWLGGELGKNFQQLRLGDVAKQMINDFDLLKRGGAEVGSILFGMKEEIVQLIKDSIKFGTTIPENMRPWIQELERAGLLVDETGEALNYDLGALRFGQPIETEVERITMAFERFIEQLDIVANKLANLPQPNVQVPNTTNPGFGDTDQFRPVPYARGGLVTRPTFAMLGEAGPELVMPLSGSFSRIGNVLRDAVDYKAFTPGIPDGSTWATPRPQDYRSDFREAITEMREDLKSWLEQYSDSLAVTMRDAAMGAV